MLFTQEKAAGMLYILAATQFLLCLIIAEALYPGYSISSNYISDLGVGPSAIVFNSSVFILGLILLSAVYLQRGNPNFKILNILLAIMAIASMGVGIFTEDFTYLHAPIAFVAFVFGGLFAIASAKIVKKPFSLISIILGVMTLTALALYAVGIVTSGSVNTTEPLDSIYYLGLGAGGMERMIIYPSFMWLTAFGGYIVAKQEYKEETIKNNRHK